MISNYTALYSKLDRLYNDTMSGPYEDLSSDGTVAAVQAGKITGYWRPVIIVENAMEEMRKLWDVSCDIGFLDLMINGVLSPASKFLLSHGYHAEPVYTHVIDTANDKWANVRKSYQNLVNRETDIHLSTDMMKYMKYHIEQSGRRTREPRTWKIQQQMIDVGEGFLIEKGDMEGAAFFMHNDKWAYYASAKCDGNSHSIIWHGIQECKRRGIRFIEMGEQIFHGNEKMINISNFKRGFGGKTYCRLLLRK